MKSKYGFWKVFFLVFLALPSHSYSNYQEPPFPTLVIYVDQSGTMQISRKSVATLANIATSEFQKYCGRYEVAISGIDYAEFGQGSLKLLGRSNDESPQFITEQTKDGLQLIRNRIECGSDKTLGESDCGVPDFPAAASEITYSSIASSILNESKKFSKVHFLGALLITDAVPAFEYYSVSEALTTIHGVIDPNKFMASSISYTNWKENDDFSCTPDRNSSGNLSEDKMMAIEIFTHATGGSSFNICRTFEYEVPIRKFVRDLIEKTGCRPIS